MTFTIARQVVVEMSHSFGAGPTAIALYERLPHDTFVAMEAIFAAAELDWHGGPAAEDILAALRATYEPLLENLSVALLLPLPGWIPAEDATDHWSRGHHGDLASLLIDELSSRKGHVGREDVGRENRWSRLRRRLSD